MYIVALLLPLPSSFLKLPSDWTRTAAKCIQVMKRTCKACKTFIFHRLIYKFVMFLWWWLLKLSKIAPRDALVVIFTFRVLRNL